MPARLRLLRLSAQGLSQPANGYNEIWIGFRSNRFGDYDEFQPNWNCGDADVTLGTNTTLKSTDDSDAGMAYGLSYAEFDGGDSAMASRVIVKMSDVTNYIGSQFGEYIVLARMRASDGAGTFHARLSSGYYDEQTGSKWTTYPRVQIPSVDPVVAQDIWYYYPMGTVTIPPDRLVGNPSRFSLQLEAQVATGSTTNLDFDTLTLIPVSEGAIHLKDAWIKVSGGTNYAAYVKTDYDESMVAYNQASGTLTDYMRSLQFDPYNWSLPTGEGIAVVAAQQEAQSHATRQVNMSIDYYPRWLSLYGT
jgi:hypothetical protein